MYIDNVYATVKAYREGRIAAENKRDEGKREALKHFKTGSRYLQEALDKADSEFSEEMERLGNMYAAPMRDNFASLRKHVAEAVTTPIPENVMRMMQSYEGMTLSQYEHEALTEAVKNSGNYAAVRRANALFNLGLYPGYELDRVHAAIARIESPAMGAFDGSLEDLQVRMFILGRTTADAMQAIQNFVKEFH